MRKTAVASAILFAMCTVFGTVSALVAAAADARPAAEPARCANGTLEAGPGTDYRYCQDGHWQNFCATRQDGDYVDPADRTKYLSCVAHKYAYERSLPPGLSIDPATGQVHGRIDPDYGRHHPDAGARVPDSVYPVDRGRRGQR